MAEIKWVFHHDRLELAAAAAATVRQRIEGGLAVRGRALIAMPGGGTPITAFRCLSSAKQDWSGVTIIPSDDRLASAEDPLSTLAVLKRYFGHTNARLLPLVDRTNDPHAAGDMADVRLRKLDWPPDLVWLGVGLDGHVASLFKGPDLDRALATPRYAVGVLPDPLPPEAPVARVSLSLGAISAARARMITITGEDKRQVLQRAVEDGARSPLPVARVLAALTGPSTIHWSP